MFLDLIAILGQLFPQFRTMHNAVRSRRLRNYNQTVLAEHFHSRLGRIYFLASSTISMLLMSLGVIFAVVSLDSTGMAQISVGNTHEITDSGSPCYAKIMAPGSKLGRMVPDYVESTSEDTNACTITTSLAPVESTIFSNFSILPRWILGCRSGPIGTQMRDKQQIGILTNGLLAE
nr:hypothetical protein CFP56_38734 [Quercus suber]